MELLYVWVEEYGNIRKQGFNFSPNYWFEDIPEEGNKTDDNSLNFFGEKLCNITAIIGKNGSGKSSLLNAIAKKIKGDTFELFSQNSSFIHGIYLNGFGEITEIDNDFNENIEVIYYDNFIRNTLPKYRIDKFHNLSFSYEKDNFKNNFISEEVKRQISFSKSSDLKKLNGNLSSENNYWKIPSELKVYIDTKQNNNDTSRVYDIEKMLKVMMIDSFSIDINNLEEKNQKILKNYFEISIEFEMIKTNHMNIENTNFYSEIKALYDKYKANNRHKLDDMNLADYNDKSYQNNFIGDEKKARNIGFGGILNKRPQKINEIKIEIENKIESWNNELNSIIEKETIGIINYLKSCLDLFEKIVFYYRIDLNGIYSIVSEEYFSEVYEFLENKKIKKENQETLEKIKNLFLYSWDTLSSGEEALLSMYSKLYSIKSTIKSENILILLDEPENYLHPEWQRKLIKTLVEFANVVFKDRNVQIILTSHSPFVASDLPRENVVMLDTDKNGNCIVKNDKKDKDIKTFGANIFDLYTNAFFVESSFGEFAKGKIKDVVKDLTPNEEGKYSDLTKERIKEIEYIIDSIGEKLVKNKLQKMYDEYRESKIKNESRKTLLEDFKKLSLEEQLAMYEKYRGKKND